MAGKKETVAKVQKKVAKKTTEKPQAEVQNKTRHFSIIYGGVKLAATPSGKRPKQAANKALTSIFGTMDEATKKKLIGQEIKFCLYENCKRKKNAKGELLDRRIFHYTGKRTETAKMTGGKTVEISHEVVVYCDKCKEDYELKSKKNKFGKKIVDGEYNKMIEKISSNKPSNFFFLAYKDGAVVDLFTILKFFFTPAIIEKRKPLSENARRAGLVGCNILYNRLLHK